MHSLLLKRLKQANSFLFGIHAVVIKHAHTLQQYYSRVSNFTAQWCFCVKSTGIVLEKGANARAFCALEWMRMEACCSEREFVELLVELFAV